MKIKYKKLHIGAIYYVALGDVLDGHCIKKTRPCLIAQTDRSTVTVFPFTSDDGSPLHNSEINIPMGIGNLKKDSKIKLGQPTTVDIVQVKSFIGFLPTDYLKRILKYTIKIGIISQLKRSIKYQSKSF
jgi:mRNA-degrading endonuclease toxin of MazEF toxin-antitoxin module